VVALADAALRRLRLIRLPTPVVLGGSVLAALPDRFVNDIETAVRQTAEHAHCVVCRDRPVVGAALTALDLAGADTTATRRLRRSLTDDRIREV
jgi:hypothetical protein